MDAFIIINDPASTWRFDVDDFIRTLQDHWPNARSQSSKPGKTAAYTWSVSNSQGEAELIEGFITETGDHIGVKATPEMCVEFALWVRRLVPANVKVLIGDDQHPEALEVTDDGSTSSLVTYFHS